MVNISCVKSGQGHPVDCDQLFVMVSSPDALQWWSEHNPSLYRAYQSLVLQTSFKVVFEFLGRCLCAIGCAVYVCAHNHGSLTDIVVQYLGLLPPTPKVLSCRPISVFFLVFILGKDFHSQAGSTTFILPGKFCNFSWEFLWSNWVQLSRYAGATRNET